MAQTPEGAMKVAALLAGMSYKKYKAMIDSGHKRCTKCKQWKLIANFGSDKSRPDGTARTCVDCRRVENPRTTKGRISTFKGRRHTEEAKQKMSEAAKGREKSPMLGKHHSVESRKKMSQTKRERNSAISGKNHHSYKDGKLSERKGIRFSKKYKRWRYDVFSRDNFTCRHCGDNHGGNLVAHHIKEFADYPELRFDVNNGLTLCEDCHKKTHYG